MGGMCNGCKRNFIIPHLSSLFAGDLIYGVIGIVSLLLISILFSLLTIHIKNIWAACGLHSFWNAILYCVLGLNLSGNNEKVTAVFNIRSIKKKPVKKGRPWMGEPTRV